MSRKTKIICGIGPSSASEEMLGNLLDAGMNVAQLHFSHESHAFHAQCLENMRAAIRKRPGYHCAVLLDTKGPEIRTGTLREKKSVQIYAGQTLEIVNDYEYEGNSARIACNYARLPQIVVPGSKLVCDGGGLIMTVRECRRDSVIVQIENDYVLAENMRLSLSGAQLGILGVTTTDQHDLLEFAMLQAVDIVAGSFVRNADDVRSIARCLGEKGRHICVHAKIESIEALKNIDEILQAADGVHVSREELEMELAPEQVYLAQKLIIRKANMLGKPVVISTQMLQSMTGNIAPSYAECTDVANAVLDGTDALMLSAETAIGMYPVRAVQMMHRICREAEASLHYEHIYRSVRSITSPPLSISESIASTAVEISIDTGAKLIISFTDTGSSTRLLAKYRPKAQILAVTASASTARQLNGVSRGVAAIRVQTMIGADKLTLKAVSYAKEQAWVSIGDIVVMTHGVQEAKPGTTNIVKMIQVSDYGFSTPTNFLFKGLHVPFKKN